jgi:hypothetical protein
MDQSLEQPKAKFGLAGFVLGALSLILVMVLFSDLLSPSDKSSAAAIGEIAAEIKLSAQRALTGAPAAKPVLPSGPDLSLFLGIAAYCVAGGAIILGGFGLYRQEPKSLSYLALGFGLSTIVMQYLLWLALLIAAVVLLASIIQNLDSIFS